MSEIARKNVAEEEEVEKYAVEDVRENEVKRHRSMFALLTWDLGLESSHHGNRDKVTDGIKGFFIFPNNRMKKRHQALFFKADIFNVALTPDIHLSFGHL
ncbi:hypothetical protein Tco_1176718 [Tanacetum coccineum]